MHTFGGVEIDVEMCTSSINFIHIKVGGHCVDAA